MLRTTKQQKHEIELLKKNKNVLSHEVAMLKARIDIDDPNDHDIVQTDNDNDILPVTVDLPSSENDSEPRPVRGAIKTTDVFIGDVLPPCSAVDIQNHIKTNTSVNPKMTDIQKLTVRGENLAFKVTVPKNKFHEVTSESVWGNAIRAESYNPQKQKKPRTPKGAKSNNRKRVNRNQTFRNQKPNSSRPNEQIYHANDWPLSSRDQYYQNRFRRDLYEPLYSDRYEPQSWY